MFGGEVQVQEADEMHHDLNRSQDGNGGHRAAGRHDMRHDHPEGCRREDDGQNEADRVGAEAAMAGAGRSVGVAMAREAVVHIR
jgi:hypothetical protein